MKTTIECFACGIEIPQDKKILEAYRAAEQPPIVFCDACKNIEEHPRSEEIEMNERLGLGGNQDECDI